MSNEQKRPTINLDEFAYGTAAFVILRVCREECELQGFSQEYFEKFKEEAWVADYHYFYQMIYKYFEVL